MSYQDGLKQRFSKLDALAALRSPVSALLGVSEESEDLLKGLGISTVFDLAVSPLFQTSEAVFAAADGAGHSAISRVGRIPGSFINDDGPQTPAALVGVSARRRGTGRD